MWKCVVRYWLPSIMWVWDSHCEGRNVPSGWGSSGGGGVGVGRTDGLTGPGASSSTSTTLRSWSSLLASKLAVQGLDFVHIDNAFLHSSHQFFFSSRLVDTITMTPDHWGSTSIFQNVDRWRLRVTLIPADIFLSCCSLAVIISIDQLVYFPPRGPISAEAGCDQRWFSTEPTSPQLAPPCPHSLITSCPSPLPCSTYPLLVQTLPLLVQPPVLLVQPPPLPYSNLLVPCSSYCPIFLFILLFGFAPF